MIALSTYKLVNYLVDSVNFNKPYKDVAWKDVNNLEFFREETSRNKCFVCKDAGGVHDYFFKQSRSFSKSNLKDLRSEAQFYKFAITELSNELAVLVPELISYDDYNGIILTKYLPLFKPLSAGYTDVYEKAGSALRTFHDACEAKKIKEIFFELSKRNASASEGKFRPWIDDFGHFEPLVIKMSHSELQELSAANNPYSNQLVSYLTTESKKVLSWRREWVLQTKGLIHGDACERNFRQAIGTVKAFDFEYVNYGAWFWDLAVFIADMLTRSSFAQLFPPQAGTPTSIVYARINALCAGYGISKEQQLMVLRWAGIYFLQLFLTEPTYFNLQCGLTLISKTDLCRQEIFN
ncbi:phosphotransferase [Dyadobacter sp. 3J3]|uniref:phosphotransferase n=1 Tax=Dyadobacter sp. 3J3 TaxID=2606600 RepID=UPI0013583909|nr:phosphotransferase [Dyadobacter sp. 3J3]